MQKFLKCKKKMKYHKNGLSLVERARNRQREPARFLRKADRGPSDWQRSKPNRLLSPEFIAESNFSFRSILRVNYTFDRAVLPLTFRIVQGWIVIVRLRGASRQRRDTCRTHNRHASVSRLSETDNKLKKRLESSEFKTLEICRLRKTKVTAGALAWRLR